MLRTYYSVSDQYFIRSSRRSIVGQIIQLPFLLSLFCFYFSPKLGHILPEICTYPEPLASWCAFLMKLQILSITTFSDTNLYDIRKQKLLFVLVQLLTYSLFKGVIFMQEIQPILEAICIGKRFTFQNQNLDLLNSFI